MGAIFLEPPLVKIPGSSPAWCLLPLDLGDVGELQVYLNVLHGGNVSIMTRSQHRKEAALKNEKDVVIKTLESLKGVGKSSVVVVEDSTRSAQTKVVSLQSLPPLPMYTGESRDITDDSFELWSEHFQERASVSWWSEEQKLYQLKFHLDKTAAEVFRVLPREEKNSFKMAMESMKLTVV